MRLSLSLSWIAIALVALSAGAVHAQPSLEPPPSPPPPAAAAAPAPAPPPADPARWLRRWDLEVGGQYFLNQGKNAIGARASCDVWGIIIAGGAIWESAASQLSYGARANLRLEGNGLLLSAAPLARYRLGQDVQLELSLGPALRGCGVAESLEGDPHRWGAGGMAGVRLIFADLVAVGVDSFAIHQPRTDEEIRSLTFSNSVTVTLHGRAGRYGALGLAGLGVLALLAWAVGPA